ncbi:MAG: hypothetical protein ACM30E_09710, partial [Nitrososphaerales archaeon]
ASGAGRSVTWTLRTDVTPTSMTPRISKATAQQAGLAASRANDEKASAAELVVFQGTKGPVLAYEVVTEGVKTLDGCTRLFVPIINGLGRGCFNVR